MTVENSVIELRLPPSLRFASVVRVVTASLAADEHFSITALAELRTAVNDAFEAFVLESVPVDRFDADTALSVRFCVSPGHVQVEFCMAAGERPLIVGRSASHHVDASADSIGVEKV